MRENIRLALQIAKPELKISRGSFIGLFLFFSLFTILFITGIDAQEARFAGLDLFFLILFLFGPTWFKPKGLQYQKISGDTWGSPPIIMGLNLPIKKEVIVLKSMFVYFISSFPFQLYMFIMLYLISPEVRHVMEPTSYISFVLIWLSFGIYGGFAALSVDVISTMKFNKVTILLSILLYGGIIVLIFFFPFFFTYGIVEWTVILANKWSLASAIISIFLAIIGMYYWKNKSLKQMKKIDYL